MVRVVVLAAVLIAVLACFAPPVQAQLYTWTDESGIVHYTADPWSIPLQHRPADLPPPAEPRRPESTPRVSSAIATVVQFSPGEPIIVTARLNGVQLSLLLDTGADRTLVSPMAVGRAGYARQVMPSNPSVRLTGVTGSATASEVTVPVLDVAGTQIGPVALIVHDAGLGSIDGLLGRDVLDAFTVTIDAAAGRATLTPR